jgi:hypothetical protein
VFPVLFTPHLPRISLGPSSPHLSSTLGLSCNKTPTTMSEHFRKSLLNRLPSLPPTRAPWADEPDGQSEQLDDNEGDDLGDLQPPSAIRRADQDLSPLSAGDYFDQALEIHPPGSDTKFRAYTTHATAVKDKPTVLVCHHGGGASGLSFATLAKQIKQKSSGELGTLTYDCRGHGEQSGHRAKLEALLMYKARPPRKAASLGTQTYPSTRCCRTFLVSSHTCTQIPRQLPHCLYVRSCRPRPFQNLIPSS